MLKFFEKRNNLAWSITILIAIIVFIVSSIPGEKAESIVAFSWQTTVYHIVIFFFLAFFLLISFLKGRANYLVFVLAIVLLISYGILDEMHQLFVPGRQGCFSDVLLDSLGIFLAGFFYSLHLKKEG